ncbi:hypothetical protein V6N12_053979 [Hibiscus sabdariffa]|uniref:Uncharacterized protein n=1 Tax=Hibiscus sabdariffa TaxID=183260 RepID=A0ABR2DAX5_9ROSI
MSTSNVSLDIVSSKMSTETKEEDDNMSRVNLEKARIPTSHNPSRKMMGEGTKFPADIVDCAEEDLEAWLKNEGLSSLLIRVSIRMAFENIGVMELGMNLSGYNLSSILVLEVNENL